MQARRQRPARESPLDKAQCLWHRLRRQRMGLRQVLRQSPVLQTCRQELACSGEEVSFSSPMSLMSAGTMSPIRTTMTSPARQQGRQQTARRHGPYAEDSNRRTGHRMETALADCCSASGLHR